VVGEVGSSGIASRMSEIAAPPEQPFRRQRAGGAGRARTRRAARESVVRGRRAVKLMPSRRASGQHRLTRGVASSPVESCSSGTRAPRPLDDRPRRALVAEGHRRPTGADDPRSLRAQPRKRLAELQRVESPCAGGLRTTSSSERRARAEAGGVPVDDCGSGGSPDRPASVTSFREAVAEATDCFPIELVDLERRPSEEAVHRRGYRRETSHARPGASAAHVEQGASVAEVVDCSCRRCTDRTRDRQAVDEHSSASPLTTAFALSWKLASRFDIAPSCLALTGARTDLSRVGGHSGRRERCSERAGPGRRRSARCWTPLRRFHIDLPQGRGKCSSSASLGTVGRFFQSRDARPRSTAARCRRRGRGSPAGAPDARAGWSQAEPNGVYAGRGPARRRRRRAPMLDQRLDVLEALVRTAVRPEAPLPSAPSARPAMRAILRRISTAADTGAHAASGRRRARSESARQAEQRHPEVRAARLFAARRARPSA